MTVNRTAAFFMPDGGERIIKTERERKATANWRPAKGCVVVQPIVLPTVSQGGIHIPETANQSQRDQYMPTPVCRVLAVGAGVELCKPGDRVLVSSGAPAAGINYPDVSNRVLMYREESIAGVLPDEVEEPE